MRSIIDDSDERKAISEPESSEHDEKLKDIKNKTTTKDNLILNQGFQVEIETNEQLKTGDNAPKVELDDENVPMLSATNDYDDHEEDQEPVDEQFRQDEN